MFSIRKPFNEHPLAKGRPFPRKESKEMTESKEKKESNESKEIKEPTDTSVEQQLKIFPNCSEKLIGNDTFLSCISIFRELGNKSGQLHLRKRLLKQMETLQLKEVNLTHEWDASTKQWYPLSSPRLDIAVEIPRLKDFLSWALERSRKTKDEKLALFGKFDIVLTEAESDTIKGTVENELLSALSKCLPFKMEYQYRVGKYRLDAFIPRLRLAIQIDEHGHAQYDQTEEKEYDEVIRDHNIVCIRFKVNQTKNHVFEVFELVRQVWERTLSPDFSVFREKHCLV